MTAEKTVSRRKDDDEATVKETGYTAGDHRKPIDDLLLATLREIGGSVVAQQMTFAKVIVG